MKYHPRTQKHSPNNRAKTYPQPVWLPWTGILALAGALSASAGSFVTDFNSGLPAGTTINGNALIYPSGGYTNSGCLQLTTNLLSQNGGTFVITNDLDNGAPVVGFVARFKAFIGGGSGADGFSFNYASDISPTGIFSEDGAGTGLTVEFDTFSNDTTGGTDLAGVDVRIGGAEYLTFPWAGLRANAWVDVLIELQADGYLRVMYDGTWIYTNTAYVAGFGFPPSPGLVGGRFGFGARTGGSSDNHWIDDLSITTYTNGQAFVDYYSPVGRAVRSDAPIFIELTDVGTQVNAAKTVLQLDGGTVVPTITQTAPTTAIRYAPPALLNAGDHTVSLTFVDNAAPVPNTNIWQYNFTVPAYPVLPASLAADPSFVNLSSPGFKLRYSQIADVGSRDVFRAELQLVNLLIDGSTGLPYDNLAAPNPVDSSFTYLETNVINYGFPAGATGDLPNDANMPGMPGPTTGTGSSYALEAVTYLHLIPGLYSLGVNSSDGFRLTAADGADLFAPVEAISNSVRVAADTTTTFAVAQPGYYPFRLVYFTGDPTYGPAPGTATPNLEFFNVDASGNRTLINDSSVVGYVPAFTAAKTRPYIRSVSPNVADSGLPGNTAISAVLVDGSLTVQTGTIALQVNGASVTPTVSGNAGVYTVSYQPAAVFLPNSSNYVSLAFTDSGSNRRTNAWYFTVANIMTPIWSIAAVNNTWVTAGSTERGMAYNPKTGHLILVSRAAAPAPAAGLGIAILDSGNGSLLGMMNIGDIASTGVGTFKLNMVDVADDGVIYVCNLPTSAAANFRIYRWQNESDTPTLVYDAPPTAAAGTPRWGDDFRVRGSGAGTQILASGNNVSANSVPLFTTVDGTNFSLALLVPTSLANNAVRLGLAWGCGNTFYGETTGTPVSYLSFNGAPSTVGALLASYGIYDKNTNQAIGPIGLDIANQRLIGNQTVAPHNINLYDVGSLAVTPAKNFPIDQRNYASQNTSFGTGSVDFSPDGSKVFCLDTGNGIIAFGLAARPAAPTICAQPQQFLLAATNTVGFMDVTAIGAPQNFQWRLFGTNLVGATNRTLDIYNVQRSNLGWYSVVISNPLGSVTSSVALLDYQMTITTPPADVAVTQGSTANFNVFAEGGTQPLAYQWKFNNVNIPGATSSTYAIDHADYTNGGYAAYTVVVSDAVTQAITSAGATLNVMPAVAPQPGTGTGLFGTYYTNINYGTATAPPSPFTGFPVFTRIDPTVDFDWGAGSFNPADPTMPVDYFQVRWTGQVQPLYSQTYRFFTTSDDGSRLWVNGQKLVEDWVPQGPTEFSGAITLAANQKYSLVYEYFERAGGAVAKLWWWSPSQLKSAIPMEQLYPGPGPLAPVFTSSLSGANLTLNWVGTCVLQTAPSVTGPWTPVATNSGPFTINVGSAAQQYFRLLSQEF